MIKTSLYPINMYNYYESIKKENKIKRKENNILSEEVRLGKMRSEA